MAYPDIDFQVSSAVNTPGVITYNFTVRNNAGTGSATAFDLNFNEAFAAYAPNAALVAGSVRASGSATAARVTSGPDTGSAQYVADNLDLRPGETATVGFVITVPEGDNTAFSVVDRLADAVAAGSGGRLNYVTGSAQVVSVGANLSSLSGRNLLAPTITTADSEANGTQDQVTLNFGGIRNVSDKAVTAADQIVVRLQVQATDVAANEPGDVLTNTVTVNNTSAVTGASTSYSATPATVSSDMVEPLLTLSKVASAAAGQRLDAGSEATYTVTLRHAEASSANAYDLVLADALPAGMTLVAGSLSSSAGTATASGGTVDLALPTYGLAAGPVTLTYRAGSATPPRPDRR
ncbi:hypothetical protein [Teichococcus vastitatis]|uniref:DUF11 domain-containing protein n=1 Tax=Teichococcus vastitatis TaxID=2307076 RepID=A0ABS9W8X2_9PROT|nr:hypothetical protein [Pseudoroseomonas vastitatis]